MLRLQIFQIFIVYAAVCDSYKILCLLPYHGKSHHMVFEPLLQELMERGHHLTVVSFFPSPSPHPNRRDVSLIGLSPLNLEVVDLKDIDYKFFGLERYLEHFPLVMELARSNLQMCGKLLSSEVFKEFVDGEGDYDLILVEHFNSDCMLGLVHNYGLPSVGLMSCALMPFSPWRVGAPNNPAYVPGMTLPFTERMTFFERLENAIALFVYGLWYEVMIRGEEQRFVEKALGRKLPRLSDVGRNASVVLVNTHHSLNGVRVLPPSVVEVGGIHLHNKTVKPLPEDLERWVSEAKHGFILFSFGSLIRGSTLPKKQLDSILKVFARLPQRIVWKWETGHIDNLPNNVVVKKWLPQFDLLNHPNCVSFITHGGLLSLTEAVSAGVPTLTSPVLGDQFGNAAHAQWAGIAEVLRLRDLDENTLYSALQRVLSEKMRHRAKRLSQLWHDRPQPAIDTAIFYIELAARHKDLELSSHARHLSWIQLALIDLIAFVVALASVPYIAFKLLYRYRKRKVKQC